MEKELEIKEIKVEVPDGYEIDKENSTFEYIRFKQIKKELPKTWKEYCKTHPRRKGEVWIEYSSRLSVIEDTELFDRNDEEDRNLLPNKKYAEAILALCQLIQLRDCYNDGWIPDWSEGYNPKYCIEIYLNKISTCKYYITSRIFAFKTRELCTKFLNNFRNLIEVAKPLL